METRPNYLFAFLVPDEVSKLWSCNTRFLWKRGDHPYTKKNSWKNDHIKLASSRLDGTCGNCWRGAVWKKSMGFEEPVKEKLKNARLWDREKKSTSETINQLSQREWCQRKVSRLVLETPDKNWSVQKNKQENIEKLLVIAATEKIHIKSMGV